MKANKRMFAIGLLGCVALFTGSNVYAEDDLEICQGGYKALLMTPGECRGYLNELRAAQSRADHMAVLDLQEWHTELLIERSQACPCQAEPAVMRNVRMMSPGQTQLAFSGKQ